MSSSMHWDLDIDAVHKAIEEEQDAITALDTTIEGYMRTIRQLQYRKQTHVEEIRRRKGMITLARRLPPEILADIFEECVRDGWTRTPLTVSHVCSSWRMAANIPTVWSHIYVNFGARDPFKRTQFWLQKAQDSALTIDLELGNDTSHLSDRMIELLMSTLPRWKEFTVKSAMLHPVNQILQACNKPAPQLQTVNITVAQEFSPEADIIASDENNIVGFRSAFLAAPQFKTLHVRRNVLPHGNVLPTSLAHLSFQLPPQQSLTTPSLSSIIHLLEELPNLESLSLDLANQDLELTANPDQVVDLPHLASLTLLGKDVVLAVLPHLSVPSLKNLHLRSSQDYARSHEIAQWIDDFLRHSSAQIALMEIRDLGLDSMAYNDILQLLPSVEELRLHDCDILDSALEELRGPSGLCPQLKKLDIRWCGRMTGRALVDLVRSRLPHGEGSADSDSRLPSAITEITLINCSFVKEDDILDLAQLSLCRLVHRGQMDFCSTFGCCENERYRRRLKQRLPFHPAIFQAKGDHRLIL